ncbi:TPA: hypothetical protein U3O24_001691 [Streptococcus agalactiae]|jgi:hypothetical protein|uniref:Transmembrane regions protein n=3 Tax=Streptococcus TaxID=1301 RepID=T1ZFQ0_STRIT|nr:MULTISPECIES: hypothetical protein [Streptococcus]HEP3076511.1 hypothetical protein [Streptococcus pyogenes]AGU77054.1 hypothetical protein SIR_1707 [Streptococcus intermedius B196]APS24337.1 hypothetical protein AV644_01365 [Streptococcus agalactiae]ASA91510.1 hypothetical protein BB159_01405 [Streptococcus agalactiae]AWZ34740.1 hypothetical protein CDH81_08485 [Streptococcus agalactiae]
MSSSNLQTWLQGDGFWFITFGAIILIILAWRNSSWGKLFTTLVFYAVIASLTGGGRQLLHVVGWFLRLFGIETGL